MVESMNQPKDFTEGPYLSGTQKFWLWITGLICISVGLVCFAYLGGETIKANAQVESDKVLAQAALSIAKEKELRAKQ